MEALVTAIDRSWGGCLSYIAQEFGLSDFYKLCYANYNKTASRQLPSLCQFIGLALFYYSSSIPTSS